MVVEQGSGAWFTAVTVGFGIRLITDITRWVAFPSPSDVPGEARIVVVVAVGVAAPRVRGDVAA
jgi:hypothetical protein